ncbi:CobW family GTP-binding protein [Pontibacillus salicampi]|uniref:CobW family GTP-binding protein n=1 Tax=Pontibacillus salicampi TaxID=1449801 RepID=A0ABV6LKN4_9BACI
MTTHKRVPVTIVTGFLGAGKTTLINEIGKQTNEKIAYIINEFGDIGIDGQLVERTEEEIIEVNNGCICCNVRGDLIKTLSTLLFSKKEGLIEFDRVVIETTGLADPAPVVQTFLMYPEMMEAFEVDSVCTIVDVQNISYHLDQKDESIYQIAFADVLIFNKTDLSSEQELNNLTNRINAINPTAKRIFTNHSRININEILGVYAFDLQEKLAIDPNLMKQIHRPHHNDDVVSVALEGQQPLDMKKVNLWFSYLVELKGESLYRYKGILNIQGETNRLIFQGVHMLLASDRGREWSKDETKKSELIFIGTGLDKDTLQEQFESCIAEG